MRCLSGRCDSAAGMLIGSSRSLRVYAYAAPADMRKGFDGLSALVREDLGRDPTSGALYLFVSRNRIRAKVLVWDGTGLCLYAKRLEQGRFASLWGREQEGEVSLSTTELALFLEGCKAIGKGPISPPEIDPNRKILGDLTDTIGAWSTLRKSKIPNSSAASAEPMRHPTGF